MMRKLPILFLFLLGIIMPTSAQTTLSSGDIAIIGLDTQAKDFIFVPFVDLAEGTIIYFTDSQADGDNTIPLSPEGHLRYTVPAGGVTAGNVIGRTVNSTDFVSVGTGTFSLSAQGDNLIAYQGSSVGNVTSYLHAVSENNAKLGTFPGGFNNFLILMADSGKYTGTRSDETSSTFTNLINTLSNWSVSGGGVAPFDFTSFTITVTPGVTVTPTNLFDFFYFQSTGPSIAQSFSVEGENLSNDISISVPQFYEISLSENTGFSNSIVLSPTMGTVNPATIYVRLMSGLTEAEYNSTITVQSPGTTTKAVNLFGEVGERPPLTLQTIWSGPLSTGLPNGIEVYVLEDIPDLSIYGLGSTNDGTGYFGQEFTFPAVAATAGQFITITDDQARFQEFFGFTADYVHPVAAISGNDAVELLAFGDVIDSYGYVGTNGAGTFWDYDDGWASRVQGTGPDGELFNPANWIISGTGVLTGAATNDAASRPVPINRFLISWTGDIDNNWFNGGNWSTGVVPNRTSSVYINPTSNPPIINGNARINNIFLFDTVTVMTGSLRANGDVDGENGSIRVESGASLLTYGSITGTGHTIIRNTTFDETTGQYSVIGSPVANANTSVLGSLVYAYDETAPFGFNGSGRYFEVNNVPMAVGDGFFSAFTGTVTFTGNPNTGNIEVPLVYNVPQDADVAGYNLISNPYPSAIDVIELVFDNTDVADGEIYIWDDDNPQGTQGDNDDYLIVNSIGVAGSNGNNYNGYVGTAQGFFVKANTTGGSYSFENDQRVRDSNADENFFRTREGNEVADRTRFTDLQKIKLNVVNSNNTLYNSIVVGFLDDATEGDDILYDANKLSGNGNLQLFSYIGDDRYAIQGLPHVTEDRVVSLGLTVGTAGNYQFNLEETVNLQDNISVYIYDKKNNTYTEIKTDSPINFSSDAVYEDQRFDLVFSSNSTLSIGDNTFDENTLRIIASIDKLTLKLSDGFSLNSAKVTVNDILGRSIINRNINESFNSYDINHNFVNSNIYFVKVESELGTIVKKIIIK